MKNTRRFRLALFVVALFCMPAVALCGSLPGVWLVQVQNPKHQVVATLKVQFTDTRAENSCMAGNWNTVRVLSAATKVKDFFPVSDPLAYQIKDGQITLGRNVVCDGYLWLQGPLHGSAAQGDYFSLGLGGTSPLGHFTLHRVQ
jgi:hypothetical protein